MTKTSRFPHTRFAAGVTRVHVFTSMLLVVLFASVGSLAQAAPPPTVVDQYTEQIPSPGGEKSSNNPGESGSVENVGGNNGQAGSAGNLGVAPDSSTGTGPGNTSAGTSNSSPGRGEAAPPDSEASRSRSGTSVVEGIFEGDGGMGIFFPIIMVASLMIACALVFMRRRGDAELDRSHGPRP